MTHCGKWRIRPANLPRIEANAGELNHLWTTNVIDNPFDAMGGSGTLRVTIRMERSSLLVEIGNTGTPSAPY